MKEKCYYELKMENAAVDNKKRDQRKEHLKGKGHHAYHKNKDKSKRDRERVRQFFITL